MVGKGRMEDQMVYESAECLGHSKRLGAGYMQRRLGIDQDVWAPVYIVALDHRISI